MQISKHYNEKDQTKLKKKKKKKKMQELGPVCMPTMIALNIESNKKEFQCKW